MRNFWSYSNMKIMDKEEVGSLQYYDLGLQGLLCEEVLSLTPPTFSSVSEPSTNSDFLVPRFGSTDKNIRDEQCYCSWFSTKEERDTALVLCLEREGVHGAGDGYQDYLHKLNLVGLRMSAIQWIIKTQNRLKLSVAVVFDAVNYMDRYISANRTKNWKSWTIELLSVACFTIAAKSNHITFPSQLLEMQMEILEHAFERQTVQRMELTVVKALDWRVNCVTPYSFVDLLACFHNISDYRSLTSRMADLLLSILFEPVFLKFRPSVLATSALRCSLEELLPSKENDHLLDVLAHLPLTNMEENEICHSLMKGNLVNRNYCFQHCRPLLPVTSWPETVVPASRTFEIFDSSIIIQTKKRKNTARGDDEHHRVEDHCLTKKKEVRQHFEQMV